MLAPVAAADIASTVRKKYSVFIYSEAEPHAMYTIYKQTRTLCVFTVCSAQNCPDYFDDIFFTGAYFGKYNSELHGIKKYLKMYGLKLTVTSRT